MTIVVELLEYVSNYNPDKLICIRKEYEYASMKHERQCREIEEKYISHSLNQWAIKNREI